jgi:hypothetical protein
MPHVMRNKMKVQSYPQKNVAMEKKPFHDEKS